MYARLVFHVRMICLPLLHFDAEPKAVDSDGDDGEQKPFDPAPEKLNRLAVEGETVAVDDGMHRFPAKHVANGPGICETESENGDKKTTEAMAKEAEETAVEF